jgi:hypothetical protein
MNDLVEQINYRGCKINIYQDDGFGNNPRRDWDGHAGRMICWHPNYDLGDKHNYQDVDDFFASELDMDEWEMEEKYLKDGMDRRDYIHKLQDLLEAKGYVMLPLYLYDHSGITMSTGGFSCPWDSGQVGFIYATLDTVNELGHDWKKWSAKRKENVKEWMRDEVKVYDQYLTNDIYRYECETKDGEQIGSCGGFFGYNDWDENGLFEHAKPAIDHWIEEHRKERFNEVKAWIKSKVPFIYRNQTHLV